MPGATCRRLPSESRLVFSPGQIEGRFKEVAARQSDDILAALFDKFDFLVVDPALLEGIYAIS
jgi:hypothetical protein